MNSKMPPSSPPPTPWVPKKASAVPKRELFSLHTSNKRVHVQLGGMENEVITVPCEVTDGIRDELLDVIRAYFKTL